MCIKLVNRQHRPQLIWQIAVDLDLGAHDPKRRALFHCRPDSLVQTRAKTVKTAKTPCARRCSERFGSFDILRKNAIRPCRRGGRGVLLRRYDGGDFSIVAGGLVKRRRLRWSFFARLTRAKTVKTAKTGFAIRKSGVLGCLKKQPPISRGHNASPQI